MPGAGRILARSDLVAAMAGRIALTLATVHPVACEALPADPDLPVTSSVLVWAGRVERHPGHAWLRRQAACARSLAADRQEITGNP